MASPGDWGVFLLLHLFNFSVLWFLVVKPMESLSKWQPSEEMIRNLREEDEKKKRIHEDDYWEGEVNYETGEVGANARPAIRHPKNRDRAYSGSAERFDDGGW